MTVPGTLRPKKQPTLPEGTTMLDINLNDVTISTGRTPDGRAVLRLGPLLTHINVTMPDRQTAEQVATALKEAAGAGSGIVIPHLDIKL